MYKASHVKALKDQGHAIPRNDPDLDDIFLTGLIHNCLSMDVIITTD